MSHTLDEIICGVTYIHLWGLPMKVADKSTPDSYESVPGLT